MTECNAAVRLLLCQNDKNPREDTRHSPLPLPWPQLTAPQSACLEKSSVSLGTMDGTAGHVSGTVPKTSHGLTPTAQSNPRGRAFLATERETKAGSSEDLCLGASRAGSPVLEMSLPVRRKSPGRVPPSGADRDSR